MRSEEPSYVIEHIQDTRWEDDKAESDKDHFDDIDYLIKKIKKYRDKYL